MGTYLPTLTASKWQIIDFNRSLERGLRLKDDSNEIRMFAYAVTESGWRTIRRPIRRWMQNHNGVLKAYVGYLTTA